MKTLLLWGVELAKPCLEKKRNVGKKDKENPLKGAVYTWSRIHWKRGVWLIPLSACTSSSLAGVEWSMSQYCSTMWSSSPTFHFFSLTLWTTAGSWNSKSSWLKERRNTVAIAFLFQEQFWGKKKGEKNCGKKIYYAKKSWEYARLLEKNTNTPTFIIVKTYNTSYRRIPRVHIVYSDGKLCHTSLNIFARFSRWKHTPVVIQITSTLDSNYNSRKMFTLGWIFRAVPDHCGYLSSSIFVLNLFTYKH